MSIVKLNLRYVALCFALLAGLVLPSTAFSEDTSLDGFQVFEKDPTRLGSHANSPTLYKVRVTLKSDALWIEGDDLDYEWLTIIPYMGVSRVVMNRSRRNPHDDGTGGGWLGKQLAKATDIKGWFDIDFVDRRGKERRVILLAPIQGEARFLDLLEPRLTVTVAREGEPLADEVASEEGGSSLQVPAPASDAPAAVALAPVAQTLPSVPVRLIDLMSVSDFRACGLNKLSDDELKALDSWLSLNIAGK